MNKKIYFAGPLFNQAEIEFNQKLTDKLEAEGFDVFLPQRDKPDLSGLTPEERSKAIFTVDRGKLLEADIFLFVLDGRVPDEGACVELGIAYVDVLPMSKDRGFFLGLN